MTEVGSACAGPPAFALEGQSDPCIQCLLQAAVCRRASPALTRALTQRLHSLPSLCPEPQQQLVCVCSKPSSRPGTGLQAQVSLCRAGGRAAVPALCAPAHWQGRGACSCAMQPSAQALCAPSSTRRRRSAAARSLARVARVAPRRSPSAPAVPRASLLTAAAAAAQQRSSSSHGRLVGGLGDRGAGGSRAAGRGRRPRGRQVCR